MFKVTIQKDTAKLRQNEFSIGSMALGMYQDAQLDSQYQIVYGGYLLGMSHSLENSCLDWCKQLVGTIWIWL